MQADRHRERMREGRTLAWLSGVTLDLKLGVRMLTKYPGLSIVSVLGMGLCVSFGLFMIMLDNTVVNVALPTSVTATCEGSKGMAPNAGPFVR